MNLHSMGICTVKLWQKDYIVKCKFFVVPGDSPVLLGMLDIELLDTLKIKWKLLIVNYLAGSLTVILCEQCYSYTISIMHT